jgi:hypothetical protein
VFLKYFSLKKILCGKNVLQKQINKLDNIVVLTALYAFIMRCLKLVVLLYRGYRSRDYFPTRRRDVSATLNGVEFQRTELFNFQTVRVVADINRTEYQLAGILIRLSYCYRILSWYEIVLAFWFFVSQQSQTAGP